MTRTKLIAVSFDNLQDSFHAPNVVNPVEITRVVWEKPWHFPVLMTNGGTPYSGTVESCWQPWWYPTHK